jgi:dUTP pyrophosphatase
MNNNLNDYIRKLSEYEELLSSTEQVDDNFLKEIEDTLKNIQEDMSKPEINEEPQLNVKVKKIHKDAVIPSYAKDGDAGLDLRITSIINQTSWDITYGFGLSFEIPKGYVGLLFPRSSIKNYSLMLSNSVGVIDSGYRGEIMVTFKKTSDSSIYYIGDKAAQILIMPYPKINIIETDELSETERGDNGYGSTGL